MRSIIGTSINTVFLFQVPAPTSSHRYHQDYYYYKSSGDPNPPGRYPGRPRRQGLLRRLLQWPPKLVELPDEYYASSGDYGFTSNGLGDYETEKRESYALDEVETMRVVPMERNANYHKRVSL